MSFRKSNIDPFQVNAFYILQACFRGGVADVIRIINSRTCRYVKRKNNPLHILVDYEQVIFPSSSVGRLNKHNK